MTGPTRRRDTKHQGRGDRTAVAHLSNPYRAREKWPEPTCCPDCGAIFHRGRWQWGPAPTDAAAHLCPACQRIRDHLPAGQLTLSGDFYGAHRDEILHLVRHVEAKERAEHPLERIMNIAENDDRTVVTFTDTHLAHAIGGALRHAYHGDLDSQWTDEGDLLRVAWRR
jgi:NMD protein affecting ribosome stability and mRNA decay